MEVFRAVMIAGSVSGAARMLFVSQPAVSKLLSHTETTLGLKLFHRTGGKLVPTAEAVRLFEEVNQVYDAAERVDQFVDNLTRSPSGTINLCSSPSLGLSLLPRLIRDFLERYPDTKIHFHTTLIQDIPQELLSGKSDLAITVLPVENPNLQIEPLIRGRMVCAIPRRHPLARQNRVSLRDLVDERLILYSRTIPFGRLMLSAFERHGCDVAPIVDVPRAELACSLVRQDVGIAIVDQFSVADDLWQGIVVRPLVEEIPIAVSLVRSRFGLLSPEAELFLSALRRAFA
ncbi:LysR substrate-binding domain-containing protein [Bordetella petrii]|uniref:LysR substrate-binding domain-containing protein n=1 Tax=Bordetella petrii TaxID=94624 RepID=UPI001E3FAF95|nr:LysR substrate-binding domain-containing protein [Bordetella petrii]MCD0501882.1 LysR substrate-binding domain-containing protein [Bordetella petrii]